jgi:histidine ammonia-lyase
VARCDARVAIAPEGLARAAAAHRTALAALARDAVYGRTTGVGANGRMPVEPGNGHGLRLLRSHAGGAGEPVSAAVARGALAIRLNQLAAGGSGAAPAWLEALASVLNAGLTPEFPVLGAIGTGDLTGLLDAELAVAALSHLALSGSAQPYAEPVQAARPHPGQRATARRLRELLGPDAARPGARVQDPYGLRALPQVHGPATDALGQVERVLRVELNAAAENPLVDAADGRVLHNGNFHGAYLGLALDCARLAVCADAALWPARLAAPTEPERTGLRPFLANGPEGSSGIMILEYTASAALAELRGLAAPAALGTAVLSRGAEEHASFSPQAARAAAAMAPRLRTVLACSCAPSPPMTRTARSMRTSPPLSGSSPRSRPTGTPDQRPGLAGTCAQDYAMRVGRLPDVHHVVVEHRHQPHAQCHRRRPARVDDPVQVGVGHRRDEPHRLRAGLLVVAGQQRSRRGSGTYRRDLRRRVPVPGFQRALGEPEPLGPAAGRPHLHGAERLRHVVVLHPRQVPHQPADGIGIQVNPVGELVRGETGQHVRDRLPDPPEPVHEQLRTSHALCLPDDTTTFRIIPTESIV